MHVATRGLTTKENVVEIERAAGHGMTIRRKSVPLIATIRLQALLSAILASGQCAICPEPYHFPIISLVMNGLA